MAKCYEVSEYEVRLELYEGGETMHEAQTRTPVDHPTTA